MKSSLHLRALKLSQRALPIMEIDDISSQVKDSQISITRELPQMPTGMDQVEQEQTHIQKAIISTNSNIPIPFYRLVKDYESYNRAKRFKRPKEYIIYDDILREGLGNLVEYDLDEEDTHLLKEMNEEKNVLSEDNFEFMVNVLEKETFYNHQEELPSIQQIEHLLPMVPEEVMKKVYNYWLERRRNLGHPLLPRFSLMRNDINPSSPYIAFRFHKDEFKKKSRKNDYPAYLKMNRLRQQMEISRIMLETIIKREKQKRSLIEIKREMFTLKIQCSKINEESKNKFESQVIKPRVTKITSSINNKSRKQKKITKVLVEEPNLTESFETDLESSEPSSPNTPEDCINKVLLEEVKLITDYSRKVRNIKSKKK